MASGDGGFTWWCKRVETWSGGVRCWRRLDLAGVKCWKLDLVV